MSFFDGWDSPASLRKIQAGSGLFMSSFVFLHIPTTISAIMGPYGYNEALNFFRKYYQAPVVEAGLLASFMAHMVSANMLYEKTDQEALILTEPWHVRWNRYTGRALMYIVPLHVIGTRIGSLLKKQRPSDYDQIRTTVTGLPSLVFLPYYSVLAAAGVYHSLQGTFLGLARLGVLPASWFAKYSKNVLWLSYIAATLAATAAGVYGFITIEGIPESAAYWQSQLPAFLRGGKKLSY